MEKNYDNLIGYEVGVLDESLKECKKITIKTQESPLLQWWDESGNLVFLKNITELFESS